MDRLKKYGIRLQKLLQKCPLLGSAGSRRAVLYIFDFLCFAFVSVLYYFTSARFYPGIKYDARDYVLTSAVLYVFSWLFRRLLGCYRNVWRYTSSSAYAKLIIADSAAALLTVVLMRIIWQYTGLWHPVLISSVSLLMMLFARFTYRLMYKLTHIDEAERPREGVAIVGAGQKGTDLAVALRNNEESKYRPVAFIDARNDKVGSQIQELPVLAENEETFARLKKAGVTTVFLAMNRLDANRAKQLFDTYKGQGFEIKVYDTPVDSNQGRQRDFSIEDLLCRKPVKMHSDETDAYYRGKSVLITGGGGSIGSELCRQLAPMRPKRIIIADIYENGAYDVQQELRQKYGNAPEVCVEIVSVTNRAGLEKLFEMYHPEIVLNAAAHKHVPLMEHNCVEAVFNNVFGTLNTAQLSEKYGVEHFIMVSTDKAVNPTNIMGATKRMCEMIILSMAARSKTVFTATRFGNVLNSAGSVIPLFRRQIAAGGPVTVTNRRVTRYFMTIPEASQLVLQSGAMAKAGELFVLDMGEPVKILDLAENMIKLYGVTGNVEIQEIGLRPGEKLIEELLIKTENLTKTANELIFIETDEPLTESELNARLDKLSRAVESNDDAVARQALHECVPTFREANVVNAEILAQQGESI